MSITPFCPRTVLHIRVEYSYSSVLRQGAKKRRKDKLGDARFPYPDLSTIHDWMEPLSIKHAMQGSSLKSWLRWEKPPQIRTKSLTLSYLV